MQRVCFTLKLKPETIEEYVDRHHEVWPEMLDALRATGWKNYSLFLAPDGLLIGYLETEDFDAARREMAAMPVNARWQTEMSRFFDSSATAPDQQMRSLPEVFHLD